MITTPYSYFDAFVLRNYYDYQEDPSDIRRVFNVCVPAYHLGDVFYKFYDEENDIVISRWTSRNNFFESIGKSYPAFHVIGSVAAAYKHFRLNKDSDWVIGTPGALWALTMPDENFDLDADIAGYADVMFHPRNGDKPVSMKSALADVVETMWPALLPA